MRCWPFILLFIFSLQLRSAPVSAPEITSEYISYTPCNPAVGKHRPNPLLKFFFKAKAERKKVIACILAFPFPFGFLGLHRLYLGTQPWMPVFYIGTVGGCLGIIPFIDFVTLLTNKDISRFKNNSRIFMWVDNEAPKK
jgi:TM2 domain-containing membrane protein YozV